ncbi:MAG: DUF934 domain-containing protein [Pseudomonadota bacterium]
MTVIVTDQGFGPEHWTGGFTPYEEYNGGPCGAVDLPNDVDAAEVFDRIKDAGLIRIPFPSFADGRGFSLARRLRMLGYRGHLRARGHVLADQYRNARRVGFDEVEIDDALAARQPEAQWPKALPASYQDRVRAAG